MQRIRQCKSLHNDEPTELENLLDMIIALEESGKVAKWNYRKHREQLAKNFNIRSG